MKFLSNIVQQTKSFYTLYKRNAHVMQVTQASETHRIHIWACGEYIIFIHVVKDGYLGCIEVHCLRIR